MTARDFFWPKSVFRRGGSRLGPRDQELAILCRRTRLKFFGRQETLLCLVRPCGGRFALKNHDRYASLQAWLEKEFTLTLGGAADENSKVATQPGKPEPRLHGAVPGINSRTG